MYGTTFFDSTSVVTLRDLITGNTYYGSVASYSDNSSNREIYFDNVYVYDKYSEFLYHAEGLYLSRAHNEFTIEIPNEEEGHNINEQQSKIANVSRKQKTCNRVYSLVRAKQDTKTRNNKQTKS